MSPMSRAGFTSFVRRVARRVGVDLAPTRAQATLSTHLLRVFETLRIDGVLDVGAHRGEYGQALRRIGFRGSIVSFEPAAAEYTALAGVASRDGAWRTHRLALSDRDDVATLHVASGTTFSSLHELAPRAARLFPGLHFQGDETVPARRLDGFLAEASAGLDHSRLFLKTDTQGHDLRVLEGAGGILDRILAVQAEASVLPLYDGVPALPEFLVRLRELGFTPSGIFPVTREADGLRLVEVDVVAVREAAVGAG